MGDRGGLDGLTISKDVGTSARARGLGTYTKREGVEPNFKPYDLVEQGAGDSTPERSARLYAESVGYKNLAGNNSVTERAKYAVQVGLKDVFNVMEFLRNKWLILYRLYRGESVNEFSYGRLPLHSPEPYKIVETIQPQIFRTLFGSDQWFRLYAEAMEHDDNSKSQEALCRKQIRAMKHGQKASRGIRDGLIYGTQIQKLWWKQEIGEMKRRVGKRIADPNIPGGTKVELEEVKTDEFTFDGNYMENVSIFDFLTSPNASDINDAEWCADRSMWPDYKVKEMAELGHWTNIEKLRDYAGSKDSSFGDEFKERKSYAYGVFDPREASNAPHIPHYEVVDWWGPLVVKEEDGSYVTKQCNVVMIEPESLGLIVRITENPYWHKQKPYQAWKPIDLEDEFYGIGAIEMIARLSREKDVKRQLLMAATQLEANPMFEVSDQANIPDGQLILQPGLCLRVPVVGKSIAPIHVPKVSDAALKAENQLTVDIRETAGTSSPTMGAQDPFGTSGKTATQHTSEIDQGKLRISPMIANYEMQMVEPMLDQMTWNNQQFLSYEQVIRETGSAGLNYTDRYTVGPEQLIGKFIVQPLASFKLLTKQTQVQQLVNLLDRIPIFAQTYGPNSIKGPALLAHVLEFGFDIRNAADFVQVPPDESDLLSGLQEQELWYHSKVPPVRADDNHLRHALMHLEELKGERFEKLFQHDPGTAARARAHVAEHMQILAITQEQQEKQIMDMQQVATSMQIQPPQSIGGHGVDGAAVSIPGAGTPTQQPGSPKVRKNELERGEGNSAATSEAKSAATQNAPNPGAQ
jgi:hypothetical protein